MENQKFAINAEIQDIKIKNTIEYPIDQRQIPALTIEQAKEQLDLNTFVAKTFEGNVQVMEPANAKETSASYGTYRLPDITRIEEVVDNLPAGGVVALVGLSGSGKTEDFCGQQEMFLIRQKNKLKILGNEMFFSFQSIIKIEYVAPGSRIGKMLEKQASNNTMVVIDEFNFSDIHLKALQAVKERYPHLKFILIFGGRMSNEAKRAIVQNVCPEVKICEIGHKPLNNAEITNFIYNWIKFAIEEYQLEDRSVENLRKNCALLENLQDKYPLIPTVLNNVLKKLERDGKERSKQEIEEIIRENNKQYNILPVKDL